MDEKVLELYDRWADAINQGIMHSDGKVMHLFMSTYEDAFYWLGIEGSECDEEQWFAALENKRKEFEA